MEKQFDEVIPLIKDVRNNAIRKVNIELINLYWQVGGYISNKVANAIWGNKTVSELADHIAKFHPELGGFTRRNLYRMKQFYELYAPRFIIEKQRDTIVSSPVTQFNVLNNISETDLVKLSWTQHLVLISRTKTHEERDFYLQLCIHENYTVKELERQINSSVYERVKLGKTTLPANFKEQQASISTAFKDSYIFEFLNLPEPHNEKDLQKALIKGIKDFVIELGKDFLFIGEEFKIQVGYSEFFIDLVFYHRSLQCLVAFELKTDKFKPEYLGKLNFYLEALDRDHKRPHENPSIGILLCKDRDIEVVEYAMSRTLSPAMVADYQMHLPDKKILRDKLHNLFE
jgi:predicted nuclease of restriction endonuclease-like (RecB) superfamily